MLVKFNSEKGTIWINPDHVVNVQSFTEDPLEVHVRISVDLSLIVTGEALDEVAHRLNEGSVKK